MSMQHYHIFPEESYPSDRREEARAIPSKCSQEPSKGLGMNRIPTVPASTPVSHTPLDDSSEVLFG